jgi:hypothetical protein
MIETYVLKEPITLGKIVITELRIDAKPKAKYWRVAQQPMAIKADMTDGAAQEATTYVKPGAAQWALMGAMTGQPDEILDELGVEDFNYLYAKADEMLGNFKGSTPQPILPSTSAT